MPSLKPFSAIAAYIEQIRRPPYSLQPLSLRFPCQQRHDPCSSRTLGKPHALEPQYCTGGKNPFGGVSLRDANVACLFLNWSGVVLEQPWPRTLNCLRFTFSWLP